MNIKKRDYYYIQELCHRWNVNLTEIEYLIENGILPAYFYLINIMLEYGDFEYTADGRSYAMPYNTERVTGLCQIRKEDCRIIFRRGKVTITHLHCSDKTSYCTILKEDGLKILRNDLVICSHDIYKFEAQNSTSPSLVNTNLILDDLYHESNYSYVRLGNLEFKFGNLQAKIVRHLHEASKTSDPWVHGKILLHQAGSRSTKIRELFKSQKSWQDLIISDGKGTYRLRTMSNLSY